MYSPHEHLNDHEQNDNERSRDRFRRRGPGGHGPGGFGFGGHGFGPGAGFGPGFGGRGRPRARRGDVRMLLISLLADAPSNGYGLIKSIAERTENQWKPSPGSVYPTLSQLVDEGLVEGTGSGRGEEYRLTDEGRAYATDNAEAMQSAWDDLAGQKQGDDPLYSSFFKLAKAIRQFDSEATPEQRKAIAEQLDAVRRELYRTLSE